MFQKLINRIIHNEFNYVYNKLDKTSKNSFFFLRKFTIICFLKNLRKMNISNVNSLIDSLYFYLKRVFLENHQKVHKQYF